MYKKLLLALGLSLLSLVLVACTGQNDKQEEPQTVEIGGILPLTGDGAAYGVPMQKVAMIAVEKVNKDGGINGKELKVIWEDGKCNGKDAAAAAQKLININKVQVIFGGFCSSETLGIAPIAEAAKVVVLSTGSSSPDVTNAGDYIFRNYPSDSSQGKILAGIADTRGLKKVAMLTEENDYTVGIEKSFKESYKGEIVSENFLPTDSDFKTQIVKLKGSNPDAIFVNPQTPAKADLLLKQLQELGVDEIQLFGNDVVMGAADILAQYPEFVEGMIGAEASYEAENADFVAMKNAYIQTTGEKEVPYPSYAATTYDGIILLAEGFKKGANVKGGMEAGAIKDWLYAVKDWAGTAGKLTIDQNGDPMAGHKPKVVKEGKTVMYEEEAAKTPEQQAAEAAAVK
ncbi:ABC transporter substrate-binding protein [Candidatus Peregrinibacteria bacterium]|nr:ABC transporter substrate-binding protein [Candidatus Peregrinibacteria bacterium]